MDDLQFDALSRLIARSAPRRTALLLIAAAGLGPLHASAHHKHHHHHHNHCHGGCGPCEVCEKHRRKHHGHTSSCRPAPDGAACAGGACQAGACVCSPLTCASAGRCGPLADGCGGSLGCGCAETTAPVCHDGVCGLCAAACPAACLNCFSRPDGSTTCGAGAVGSGCSEPCLADADCPAAHPVCVATITDIATTFVTSFATFCGGGVVGTCHKVSAC